MVDLVARAIYDADTAFGAGKGFKPGWSKWRYKELFGAWPPFPARAAAAAARAWCGHGHAGGAEMCP